MLDQPPKKPSRGFQTGRKITQIRSPLGFYALALSIVEFFLLGANAMFALPLGIRIASLVAGVVLFLVIVGIVTVLVIRYPQSLVFTEESHLQWHQMDVFGDNSHPLLPGEDRLINVPSPTPSVGLNQPDTDSGNRSGGVGK